MHVMVNPRVVPLKPAIDNPASSVNGQKCYFTNLVIYAYRFTALMSPSLCSHIVQCTSSSSPGPVLMLRCKVVSEFHNKFVCCCISAMTFYWCILYIVIKLDISISYQ